MAQVSSRLSLLAFVYSGVYVVSYLTGRLIPHEHTEMYLGRFEANAN